MHRQGGRFPNLLPDAKMTHIIYPGHFFEAIGNRLADLYGLKTIFSTQNHEYVLVYSNGKDKADICVDSFWYDSLSGDWHFYIYDSYYGFERVDVDFEHKLLAYVRWPEDKKEFLQLVPESKEEAIFRKAKQLAGKW